MSDRAFGLDVDLQVNLSTINREKEYLKGMPIILKLHLINDAAGRQSNRRRDEKGWPLEVKVKITSSSKKWHENITFKVHKISREDNKIKQKNIHNLALMKGGMVGFTEEPEGGTDLIGKGTARRKWYITPEETSTLEPGEYQITAIYDNTSLSRTPGIYAGKFISKVVTINLREPVDNVEQAEVNIALAQYHKRLREYDKAIESANKALELDPAGSQIAHSILGGIYQRRHGGDLAKAVQEYEIYIAYLRTLSPSDDFIGDPQQAADILESSVRGWKKKLGMQ